MTHSSTESPGLLFAYGTLGPDFGTAGGPDVWQADAVRGRLFDLGAYPALIDADDPTAPWVEGHVRPVSLDELVGPLDTYEGVGEGLFRRVILPTRAGRRAWVYLYHQPLPPGAVGPLVRWRPRTTRPADGGPP